MSILVKPRPPDFLEPLFWDVDFAALDRDADGEFILGRILAAGTLEDLRWARRSYGDEAIRTWIMGHAGRQLSGPQLRFWEAVIGLPEEQVAAWLATPERKIWEGSGRS